jgi:hypothetical protein
MKRTRNIEARLRIYRPRFIRIDGKLTLAGKKG